MDMEGLHSFVAVAREKSISRAAQALHVTQPTLSARLKKLERDLGVSLLERSWDGIRLTKHGRFFLTYSIGMFEELEEAATLLRRREAREPEGPIDAITNALRLRVGVESFFFPAFVGPIIQGIQAAAPDTECKFVTKTSDLLLNLTDCDSLDLCLHYETGPRPNLGSRRLANDRLVLLYPKTGYPDILPDMSNARLLKDERFVLFESAPLLSFPRVTSQAFLKLFGDIPDRFHIVQDIEAALDIVASGFGYTFVPVTSIYQLLGGPLPFHALLMPEEYLSLPILLSCPASPASPLPVAQLAPIMLSALQTYLEQIDPAYKLE
ncbi:LysR family transcriptional regulator [Cohnella sp. GCM10012308]|uniref:LysR family transcriptional regulator n=1 Tax=Cohnella sp. GCM10012308 TaxID=3317329 RepID=UPI00361AA33A